MYQTILLERASSLTSLVLSREPLLTPFHFRVPVGKHVEMLADSLSDLGQGQEDNTTLALFAQRFPRDITHHIKNPAGSSRPPLFFFLSSSTTRRT